LEDEVIGLRTPHAVRRDHDSVSVLNVRVETFQPVGAGSFKAIDSVNAFAREIPIAGFIAFERAVEFPSLVGGIEIMRRDENLEALRLGGLEDALYVRDGVLFSAFVRECISLFTQASQFLRQDLDALVAFGRHRGHLLCLKPLRNVLGAV
jgi:hypothetical protein